MPFYPTQNTVMCHIRFQNGTNLEENTHAFHYAGSPPPAGDLLGLATQIGGGALLTALRACLSNSVVFREVYCRDIAGAVANEGTYTFPPGTTGSRTGGQVASNEACGIVKRTGLTGRRSHGRNSISNFVEGDVDGNTIGSSLIALLTNLAAQLLVDYVVGSNSFIAALAHIPRQAGVVGNSDLLTEAVILDNDVDSQKTRLNRHGS